MITKNWLDDACERYMGNIDCSMLDFLIHEEDLIDGNEIMIEEEGLFENVIKGWFPIYKVSFHVFSIFVLAKVLGLL
jgi:hypothetical protein